jgi:predicted permease
MKRDLQAGLRQFVTKPLFCALSVLLLAVGIGANVLIFSFLDSLILKPLPVRDSEHLWLLEGVEEQQVNPNMSFSYGQFLELSKHSELFTGVTAESSWGESSAFPSSDSTGVRLVTAQILAPNYFKEMGVVPQLGRALSESDAKPSTNIPAMVSDQFWHSHFGGRPDILGQTIRLKNFPFTIVGVLPRDFHSVDIERAPDVRLPISAVPFLFDGKNLAEPRTVSFLLLAHLRPGVNPGVIQQAAGEQLYRTDEREFLQSLAKRPEPLPPDQVQLILRSIREQHFVLEFAGNGVSRMRTQFSRALNLLMAGVGILLIAVCANVAGLLVARGEERRKELAVRLSIGASRWRVLRQLMVENLMRILPPVRSLDQFASPQILTLSPDLRVLLFAWLALLMSVCFFGLIPAWRATRLDLNAELKGTAQLPAHSLASLVPVTIQVTLSVLLLAAGGLMLRSYWNLEHLNPGFDRTHVLSFTLGMQSAGLTTAQAQSYADELEQRVRELPGVRSVAFSTLGLMRGSGLKTTVTRPGLNLAKSVFLNTSMAAVTPSYFQTLGIPLLAGRNLLPQDNDAKPFRGVINRALADLLYPHRNAVGQWLVQGRDGTKPPTTSIVGVVETAKFRRMQELAPPTLYYPMKIKGFDSVVMFVRTNGNPATLVRPAEDVIRKMGGGVPLVEEALLEQEVQNTLWQERLVARLASFFSLIALLLAGIGLYGTLTFSVARRQRELGIRIAIGAQIRHIVTTICGRMSGAVGLGLAVGLLLAASGLRLTRSFLFDVEPSDKISFGAAVLSVLICTAIAACVPCWQAVRTDAATCPFGKPACVRGQ